MSSKVGEVLAPMCDKHAVPLSWECGNRTLESWPMIRMVGSGQVCGSHGRGEQYCQKDLGHEEYEHEGADGSTWSTDPYTAVNDYLATMRLDV